jgi:phosphate starvation-inducible membrane PsiE
MKFLIIIKTAAAEFFPHSLSAHQQQQQRQREKENERILIYFIYVMFISIC